MSDSLFKNKEDFYLLANTMPDIIWCLKPTKAPEFFNHSWYKFIGLSKEEAAENEWSSRLHPDDFDRVTENERIAFEESGQPFEAEYRLRRGDGVWRWMRERATPVYALDGTIQRWIGACTDITLQHEEHERLQEALQAAEISRLTAEKENSAKTDFLTYMMHEIRTPMNVVSGVSSILNTSQNLNNRELHYVRILQASANALLHLINRVLDVSKVESHMVAIDQVSFCLYETLKSVIKILSPIAEEKKITFKLHAQNFEALYFKGDPTRIYQILTNLCSNALKFTEQGSVDVFVSQSENKDMSEIEIKVQDTGIGIVLDQQDMIFQKFTQADTGINRRYGGTGLGLFIAKSLAEAMNGNLQLESQPGQGATFTFTLPLALAFVPDMSVSNGREKKSGV